MKYISQAAHGMSGMIGLVAILGAAALMAVVAACGNGAGPTSPSDEVPTPAPEPNAPTTPIVSPGGPVKDYVSLVDGLRAAGATVDPAGTVSQPFFAPQGQLISVDDQDVQAFEFASGDEADTVAETVSADGSSIGTSMVRWIAPPHFYKAGRLIVLYVGCDSDVVDVLEETMGPEFAGDTDLLQCPEQVPPTTLEIGQALEAAEGSEVTVSGHLVADRDGNTRLCSALLESDPPQCGGDRIGLLGFDASSVPNSETPQRPSEIGTVRWTDSYITVTGIKRAGGLAEVRLSDEPAADSTEPPLPSPASQAREQIRCFPTGLVAQVGASVGDSWTLAGSIRLQGKTPEDPRDLRDGGQSSVTFTLTGLDDGGRTWLVDEASGKRARIENSEASVHTTTVYRDAEGNTVQATDRDGEWAIFVIHGSDQALLTPDWDCHRNAWLTGGIPSSRDITRESSVGEVELPTRSTVLFIETAAYDDPDTGDEFAIKSVYGYDKVTGRLVLTEQHQSGTLDGQPYTLDIVREWVPAADLSGINVAPPAPPPAVTGMIAPNLRLTFKGVEYTGVEVLSAASPTGPVMCCGTPINMDDMEVVGPGTNHNPDGDASVEVYRPKADATTDVYTFHPSQTLSQEEGTPSEDETDTAPATWTRWTAK